MAWNASDGVKAPKVEPKKSGLNGLVAGAIVVIAAVVAFFVIRSPKSEEPKAEVEQESAPVQIAETTPSIPASKPESSANPPKVDKKMQELRKKVAKMTPEQREDFVWEQLEKRNLNLEPTTNRPFRTSVELQMARIFTTEVGDRPPPPMPPIAPLELAHLQEIINADNRVLPTDSPEVRNAKETLQLAKKELDKYIQQGGDPDSFIDYYYSELNVAFQERQAYLKEVMETCRSNPEIAGELYRTLNKKLEEKGIKRMEIPDKVKQRFGLED